MYTEVERIAAFGVEYRLLVEEHLPVMLQWRNHPAVLPFMKDTRPLTPDILRYWFRRICDDKTAIYYIVFKSDKPIGFVGLSNIDRKSCTYEDEIFLNPEYFGQRLSFNILLCRELILDKLCLETALIKIRKKNTKSISLFKKSGYECIREEGDFTIYQSDYVVRRKVLRNIAIAQGMEDEFIFHFGQE